MDEDTKNELKRLQTICKEGDVNKLRDALTSNDIGGIINRRVGRDKKAALHVTVLCSYVKCSLLVTTQTTI